MSMTNRNSFLGKMAYNVTVPGNSPYKITKWKVKKGQSICQTTVLALYQVAGSDKICKLKCNDVGTVKELLIDEGQEGESGSVALTLDGCKHPTVMKDMCADCGADLRLLQESSWTPAAEKKSAASVAMIHSIPELIVSEEQALEIGRQDEQRLLKHRKLVLLVDLDQTLLHTTNDTIPPNLKDVEHFQLWHGRWMWYHTKFRPGTKAFLESISQMYELHICTFGVRMYAHTIAGFLDPDKKYFSHRILSRDECFSANSKTANLKSLFPCGDSMVCIIDDRDDVWKFAPNLIHVKPYHFFCGTADINAPPGLGKDTEDSKAFRHNVNIIRVPRNKTGQTQSPPVDSETIQTKDTRKDIGFSEKCVGMDIAVSDAETETQQPITDSVQVSRSTQQPITDSVQVSRSTQQSITDSVQVSCSTQQPITDSVQVSRSTQQPITDSVQVSRSTQQPITDSVQVSRSTQQPIRDSVQVSRSTQEQQSQTVSPTPEGERLSKPLYNPSVEDITNQEAHSTDGTQQGTDSPHINSDSTLKSELDNAVSDERSSIDGIAHVTSEPSRGGSVPCDAGVVDCVNDKEKTAEMESCRIDHDLDVSSSDDDDDNNVDSEDVSQSCDKKIELESTQPAEPTTETAIEATEPSLNDSGNEGEATEPRVNDSPSEAKPTHPTEESSNDTKHIESKQENQAKPPLPTEPAGESENQVKSIHVHNVAKKETGKNSIAEGTLHSQTVEDTKQNNQIKEDLGDKIPQNNNPGESVLRDDNSSQETRNSEKEEGEVTSEDDKDVGEKMEVGEYDEIIEWEDTDDYLIYLEDVLRRVHTAYYEMFDQVQEKSIKEIPDMKRIIPYVKKKVLKGINVLFSGVIPMNQPAEKSRAYNVAKALGANIHKAFMPEDDTNPGNATTHLVAAKVGTAKVNAARKFKNVKIVNPDWLWTCAERWELVDERLFQLSDDSAYPFADSPDPWKPRKTKLKEKANPTKNEAGGKQKEAEKFADYNPLYAFTSSDIQKMDDEVDEIFDESESEDSEGELRRVVLGFGKKRQRESSSEESMSADCPRGWGKKKKLGKASSSNSSNSDDIENCVAAEDELDDESEVQRKIVENPEHLIRMSDQSSNDSSGSRGSISSLDDEMAAALEKEFLSY